MQGILCESNFSLAPQGLLPRAPFLQGAERPGGYNQNRPKISRLRKLWDRKRRLGLALHKPLFAGQAPDKGVMPLTEARRPSVFPDRGARATYKSESRHRQRGVITPKKGAHVAYKSGSRHRKSRAISFTKSLLRGAHAATKSGSLRSLLLKGNQDKNCMETRLSYRGRERRKRLLTVA
jgi:hypothetical protein